jgi:hypothetical protein
MTATPAAATGHNPSPALPQWPADPGWQDYVPGFNSDDVTPVAITRAHGNVTNPDALVTGAGTTTMTMTAGGPPAVIVVDYGQENGGTPYLTVDSASGNPQVRISTSEALPFLNANQNTTLAADAAAGATNVKVASTSPFYAGTEMTIGTGATAQKVQITGVGTAAVPNTSLALPAESGDTTVNVASVNGLAAGGVLTIGSGAGAQDVTISGVGTAAGPPTTLVYPAASGDTNVKVASSTGFAAGSRLLIGTGGGAVVRTATDVGTAATTTRLVAPASAGDTNIKVASVAGLTVGAAVDIDPGPLQENVTIAVVGTAGVSTSVRAANTTTGLPVPSYGDANWIWNTAGASSSAPSGTIYVRKTFDVADASAVISAAVGIAVDDEHDTYVNGTLVSSLHIANGWRTYSVVDIKPYLVTGTNVIAVAATNGSGAGSMLAAFDIDGTHFASDASWKALAGTPATPPAGWNTAAFDDSAWSAAFVSGLYGIAPWNSNVAAPPGPTTLAVSSNVGFAAGDVITVGTGGAQETRTVTGVSGTGSSQIITVGVPFDVVHNPGDAVLDTTKPGTGIDLVVALTNGHGVLATLASPGTGITFTPALGADVAAGTAIRGAGSGVQFTPALSAAAPAGTVVSSLGTGVSFTPALTATHTAGDAVSGVGAYVNDNGSQINFTITGANTYTGSLRGGFRFEAIELRSPGTVTLSRAGTNFKAYRATPAEYQGWFASSDDQLNRMWYAGAYTAQMDMVPVGVSSCFTKPVIFDGAKRDRAIWSGDLLISDPVALLSLGSNAAPYVTGSIDAFMNLQAANGRLTSAVGFRGCGGFDFAVTYSAYAAMIAIQYYRYTGDTAYITPLLPKLEAALAYSASRLDGNGLIVTNDNDYWQRAQNGEVTEYNLAYYEFLQDMVWLESHIGTPEKVAEYSANLAALKDAINATLFNSGAGLYQHTDGNPGVFPLDANMNAVRLGVAPADQVQHILDYFQAAWVEHGSEISQPSPSMTDPYGHTIEPLNNTWEMLARLKSNDAAGALDLMRRLWGLQVDPNSGYYTGTNWEFVLANGLPSRGFDSLAHAWGAGPTQVLTEATVGATAVDPGYATWQVKPQPVDLQWAQGQVPTAHGPLTVKWAQDGAAQSGDANGRFHMEVTAPASTSGEVWVPLSSATKSVTLVLKGDATFVRRDGSFDVYSVGEGVSEFSSAPVSYAAMRTLVSTFSTKWGVALALNIKLTVAQLARNDNTEIQVLDAFIHLVNAQSGKALTAEQANLLVVLAEALKPDASGGGGYPWWWQPPFH